MRIFLDTNVLISSLAFGGRRSREMLIYLLGSDHEILVSDHVYAEFVEKIREKKPEKAEYIESLMESLPFIMCPGSPEIVKTLRDSKDDPVLSDALYNGADVILTNDRDFLDSNIEKPQILSLTELIEMFDQGMFK